MARTYNELSAATLAFKIREAKATIEDKKAAPDAKKEAKQNLPQLISAIKKQGFLKDGDKIDYAKIRASWDKKPAAKKAAAKKTAKKKAGRPAKKATA
jgi:DNA-binding transcriptional regulator YhcF (GntR family)